MKLLYHRDLKAKGIKLTMPTLRKKEADGTFPMRLRLTERDRPWAENLIDEYLRKLAEESAQETEKARKAATPGSDVSPPARESKRSRV
jgi:predicted DNA-binding transcriptional regulator AlpA